MQKIHCESVDRLFQTILNLQSLEECYAYFEDLCTIKEILDMSQRLDTAILLSKGLSYQKIKRLFYNPLTFKKRGASFMDLFFMERPQRVIYDIPEVEEFKPKPGEIFDPIIPIDDVNRITGATTEELDNEDEE